MASATATALRGSGKNVSGGTDFIVTIYFSGSDVPADIEGQPYEYSVRLAPGFNLGDFRTAIAAAIQSVAGQLGLTVGVQDTQIPSYEHGA
jgi:hypothetical protein